MYPALRSVRRALWLGAGLCVCLSASGCARMHAMLPARPVQSPAPVAAPADVSDGTSAQPASPGSIKAAPTVGQYDANATSSLPSPKTWLARASSDVHARIARTAARFPFTHPATPAAAATTPAPAAASVTAPPSGVDTADTAEPSTTKDQSKGKDGIQPVRIALQPPTTIAQRGQNRPSQAPPASSAPTRRPATTAPVALPSKDPAQTEAENASKAMQTVVASTRARLDAISSYQLHLTRQERVGSSLQDAENVVLSVRREPRAIRIEWKEGPHKGREVLYTADRDGGVMQVNMGDSLVPLPRISMRPDSPMALAQSRHPITEAGFETIVARLETTLAQSKAGDKTAGRLYYPGLETIPESAHPCHKFQQAKPDGETWVVYIDSQTKLPALVRATAGNGDLLERYVFRDVKTNVADLNTAEAFDADQRWGEAPSLLKRLARANIPDPQADITQTR